MTKWTIDKEPSQFPHKTPQIHLGRTINLLTEKEFEELPNGALVVDIFGCEAIKGKDYIDNDTRGGYLAFGILQD